MTTGPWHNCDKSDLTYNSANYQWRKGAERPDIQFVNWLWPYCYRKGAQRPDLQQCKLPVKERSTATWHTILLTVTQTVVGREQSDLIDNTICSCTDWLLEESKVTCHDLAKRLSHYLYFFSFLFFSFILDLLHRGKCGKVLRHKYYIVMITWQEVTASHHMISHNESHDRHGKIVHRPCSSCISSVENLTGTLSSSPCQTLIKKQLA